MRKKNIAVHIIAEIGSASFYRAAVNGLTMSESVPRVLPERHRSDSWFILRDSLECALLGYRITPKGQRSQDPSLRVLLLKNKSLEEDDHG